MRKYIYIVLLALFIVNQSSAQHAYFAYEGTISYDKTIFAKNLLKRYINYTKDDDSKRFFNEMAQQISESVVLKKQLVFNQDEVNYTDLTGDVSQPAEVLKKVGILENGMSAYQNLKNKTFKSNFELGGQDILIQDSLLGVKWKITNEYRNIAGYSCRRANGLVLDSVYVIAFFTEEIPVSAGPASFRGLPGMILGVAVPELHFNMFATNVDLKTVPSIDANLTKKKTKPMTRKAVYDQLNSTVGGFLGEKIFNLVMAGYFL